MTATDQHLRLPTDAEIENAKEAFGTAVQAVLHVTFHIDQMSRLANEEAEDGIHSALIERPPTFEDIGRFFSWIDDARMDLEEIGGYVEGAAKQLRDLDYVRRIRSSGEEGGDA
jgi:hypothetical protein